MMISSNECPIIIFGMHRSGTSLLTRILDELGLFVGSKKESNHESVFFLGLNGWVFRQCGGRWDQPSSVKDLSKSTFHKSLVVDYLKYLTQSPRIVKYLGWANYLKYWGLDSFDQPWGWKDPKNTFSFPFWAEVFSEVRGLHIRRHGIDVAQSLRIRERESMNRVREKYEHLRNTYAPLYWMRRKKSGFGGSERCVRLQGSFDLWKEYMSQAECLKTEYGSQIHELKYEDLLNHPVDTIQHVAEFCCLDASDNEIERVASRIRPSRAYAYLEKSTLRSFARKVDTELHSFGYSPTSDFDE
jgi:hypothetical protein